MHSTLHIARRLLFRSFAHACARSKICVRNTHTHTHGLSVACALPQLKLKWNAIISLLSWALTANWLIDVVILFEFAWVFGRSVSFWEMLLIAVVVIAFVYRATHWRVSPIGNEFIFDFMVAAVHYFWHFRSWQTEQTSWNAVLSYGQGIQLAYIFGMVEQFNWLNAANGRERDRVKGPANQRRWKKKTKELHREPKRPRETSLQ